MGSLACEILLASILLLLCHGCPCEGQEPSEEKGFYPDVPPVLTIKTRHGDIIDCVDIYKQPAMHHPDLRNHKIQVYVYLEKPLEPSHIIKRILQQHKANRTSETQQQIGLKRGCPKGSVPILKATKRGAVPFITSPQGIAALMKSPHHFNPNGTKSLLYGLPKLEDAEFARVSMSKFSTIAGSSALFPLLDQFIEQPIYEFSGSCIKMEYRNNVIKAAGIMTNAMLYGDLVARLFVYSRNFGGYPDGVCYNDCMDNHKIDAERFVTVHDRIHLGSRLEPHSVMIGLFQDREGLVVSVGGEIIGYWPYNSKWAYLDFPVVASWGGATYNAKAKGHHTASTMGTGKFPTEGISNNAAATITHIKYFEDGGTELRDLPEGVDLEYSNKGCYAVKDLGTCDSKDGSCSGRAIAYGGPGYNPLCP